MFGLNKDDKSSSDKSCPAPPTPNSVIGSKHDLLQWISLGCLAFTALCCLTLALMHLARYSVPKEQRQIIRIIFAPLVMAAVAYCSFFSYDVAEYLEPIGDLYESWALASLFLLFVQFSVPSGTFGQELFESMAKAAAQEGNHPWAKTKWIFAFQFPIVEPILLIATEASLAAGTYCQGSMKPRFASLWISIIRTLSTVCAVMACWKLYKSTKTLMKPHRAISKLLCFKVIVGLNILQQWIVRILVRTNALKPSDAFSYADLLYGIPMLLVSVESALFALSFHYAYSWGEYKHQRVRKNFFLALLDAMNPTDLILGMGRAVKLIFAGAAARKASRTGYSPEQASVRPLAGPPDMAQAGYGVPPPSPHGRGGRGHGRRERRSRSRSDVSPAYGYQQEAGDYMWEPRQDYLSAPTAMHQRGDSPGESPAPDYRSRTSANSIV